jgi:hypothetical protein
MAWFLVSANLGDGEAAARLQRLELSRADVERAAARAPQIAREAGVDAPRLEMDDAGPEAGEAPALPVT